MSDLISRAEAIQALDGELTITGRTNAEAVRGYVKLVKDRLERLPSAQPTLYGYKIEHLAYIARVMEKEGVTADYAVRTFDDMSRAIKMIIDETQQKVEEALNGRLN
jgi:hypothetical protein